MADAPLPSSFDREFFEESRWQHFIRRLKEEPLIPLGVGVTCWAFWNASKSIRTGNGSKTNQYFRYRLYAQSFTLVAMLAGSIYYNADRLKRKEYTDLVKQKKAQEKKEAWIRELEARDLEDQGWREKVGKVRVFQSEESEREALEEKRKMEGESDDGRGVIAALKEKANAVKDAEARKEAAELAQKQAAELEQKKQLNRERRKEMEKKQETEKMKQAMMKQEAGMGPDTRVWGVTGGGFFGWKHIRDWYNQPKDGDGED